MNPTTNDHGCLVEHFVPRQQKHPFPLVMIHGAWGTGKQFSRCAEMARDDGIEVFVLTLRGHYWPFMDPGKFGTLSINNYADDVTTFINANLRSRNGVMLLGHSMGALVALCVAKQSTLVKKLVLLGSASPKGTLVCNLSLVGRAVKYVLPLITNKPVFLKKAEVINLLFSEQSQRRNVLVEDFEKLVPESGKACREALLGEIYVAPSHVAHCEKLIVAGERDVLCPVHQQLKIATLYGGEMETISGADHMFHMDYSKRTNLMLQIILPFIRKKCVHQITLATQATGWKALSV